jgi:hypothetical protein
VRALQEDLVFDSLTHHDFLHDWQSSLPLMRLRHATFYETDSDLTVWATIRLWYKNT